MTYGRQVFDLLLPTFVSSCCTAYKSDFLDHDRDTFERTAVPGISYLWHIRPNGTHLLVLGVRNEARLLESMLRDTDPKHCELYEVAVRASGCKVRAVTPRQALGLAAAEPRIRARRVPGPFGATPTCYVYDVAGQQVGSAAIAMERDCKANRTYAHVTAAIDAGADRATQVRVEQTIVNCCTREAGSLFVSTGKYVVNDMPFDEWHGRLTTRPASAEPLATPRPSPAAGESPDRADCVPSA